jgi:hypothetical protein
MKKEIHLKGRWDRLKYSLQIGITLVIGTTLVVFSRLNITTAFTLENLEYFPIAQLPTFLLFETIFVISFWIQAALGDFQIFRDYFEEYAPPLPRSSLKITVSIAILLGLLGYFSYKIIIYSSIFVCLTLFEIWGLWLRNSKLRAVLKRARDNAPAEDQRRHGWGVIESYYLQRPQVPLAVTVLFFSFISLIISLLGELLSNSEYLLTIAYVIMLLTIAIAEGVYRHWRHKRDDALGEDF